jgi:DNA-binding GntR family transcriptional regulator
MGEAGNNSKYSTITRTEHQSLADIAYNALVTAIVNQDFEPGLQLSIDGLAKQLAMSNTPVREALMRANGERLVRQKSNHGFVVAELLTHSEMDQLFDTRHLLEVHAVQSAVLSSEASDGLKALVNQMLYSKDGAAYNDYKDYLQLDHQFHHRLVSLAENVFLLKAWEDLHVHLHLSRLYKGIGLFDRSESAQEHQAILDALELSNQAQLAFLLGQHILKVKQRIGAFFRE